ncbi:MAG: L-seryl-tRNA(Sec) selenium transferase [Planctomycetota bacterium]
MSIQPDPSRSAAMRRIPSLDAFVRAPEFAATPRPLLLRVARGVLDDVRARALRGDLDVDSIEVLVRDGALVRDVLARSEAELVPNHCRVFNATGVVLHTGLGRAPLPAVAIEALVAAARYAVVEIDRRSGERNQRETAVAGLLRELLGVGGALVVNNNAAAVTLMLRALAEAREVVVSRGEQVEIGGGFRMPDVMRQAGCAMVEVGATNRTHLRDFAGAMGERTAMLLKIHPSNFRMLGFVGTPSLADLVELGRRRDGVLVAEDLGSGLLWSEPIPGLEEEPRVRDSVATGADLVLFSGDKLLGGPQCGILVGDAGAVARCRAHPLYRALRCDKLTLAALEATLRIYRDGAPLDEVPTLRALSAPVDELRARASDLRAALGDLAVEVVDVESFAGSGANPARPLPSCAVALAGGGELCARLRGGPGVPVFARVDKDRTLVDLRSLVGEDLQEVAAAVRAKA